MALPKVIFNIAQDGLGGLVTPGTKVPGLILSGATVVDGVTIGESYKLFSLKDATDLGIDEANNAFAYKQIADFYTEAGSGTPLWVMLVPDTTVATDVFTDNTLARKLVNDAAGELRVFSCLIENTNVGNTLADIVTIAQNAQVLAEEYEVKYMPFRVVVPGIGWDGNVANLEDLTALARNKVAVFIGSDVNTGYPNMGLVIGRLASEPVQRKLSRVKSGIALSIEAYFTDGTTAESKTDSWEAIDDKGYIFYRTFAGRSGYYFTSDRTATASTDDFRTLANGFVMDKAMIIAYDVLVQELSDEVPITPNGNIHPAIIKSWQTNLETNINGLMVNEGELSAVKAIIEPDQNVLSTGKVEVKLQLLPVGYSDYIEVNIGFTTEIEN